jgi:hypothetical protein
MTKHTHTDVSGIVEDQKQPAEYHNLLPAIEDIILMVHESIRKIPHVTSNLSKIAERNEHVTAEMLSVADRLNENVSLLSQGLQSLSSSTQRRKELNGEINNVLSEYPKTDADLLVLRLKNFWREYESLPAPDETIQAIIRSLEMIQNDSTSIVMSLQIQDITSQHIEAINHLIDSVHNRLTIILQKFYGAEFQAVIPDSSRKKLSDYISKQSKKSFSHDVLPDSAIETQNEIDRMFTEK